MDNNGILYGCRQKKNYNKNKNGVNSKTTKIELRNEKNNSKTVLKIGKTFFETTEIELRIC